MTIPRFVDFILPVLKTAEHGVLTARNAVDPVAKELLLKPADINQLSPSGKSRRVAKSISWAISYLRQARLIRRTKRGEYVITEEGSKVLASPPSVIDNAFLWQYESFRESHPHYKPKGTADAKLPVHNDHETPEDTITHVVAHLDLDLLEELKAEIIELSAEGFLRLAQEVVETLRYGSNDPADGFDTELINVRTFVLRDPLGLESICVRAVHKTMDLVSKAEFADFISSMGNMRNGIYITDGSFPKEVRQQAEKEAKNISLIDLDHLTSLMLRYNIGLRIERMVEIKSVDKHFFDELGL
ncbi:MAG: restriction endonuclease [Deltaproteobacteria bacterium]|jgi:restriction system protein|nr:restriction endonuclease [Deltaproteobacteria bacterium]